VQIDGIIQLIQRDRQPEPESNDFNINFRWNKKNGREGSAWLQIPW